MWHRDVLRFSLLTFALAACGSSGGDGADAAVQEDAAVRDAPPLDESLLCTPGATESCYSGAVGTEGVGACTAGTRTCDVDGLAWGACEGEVTPTTETCNTTVDDDCDGMVNEEGAGCACVPGATMACYSGPGGTQDVGLCHAGVQTCNELGTGYGPCVGEVVPGSETCATASDDDCDGMVNEEGEGCVCQPNATTTCYSGPTGTGGVGICAAGTHTCNAMGTAFGACTGETLPGTETCNTSVDDDCDGMVNEEGAGCVCLPSSTQSCYSGPAGTRGVGVCKAGVRTCNTQGTAYGACTGEVVPTAENCSNNVDDNCDGQINEGCSAIGYAADVQPILAAKCAPCHTTGGSGSANFATSYADTQLPSYYCPGKTKGACTIVRIQEGSMPQGAGCTGNPTADAGKPQCLTAAQQATIQAWITGGQQP